MQAVGTGKTLRFERLVKRKDGSTFPAEISLKRLDNGMVQAIFHDITERRIQEQKISRLSRIHAVLSGINSAIVRMRDRSELFQEACRIAVDQGGFSMAWIGLVDRDALKIKPVAWAGAEQGFLAIIEPRLSLSDSLPPPRPPRGRSRPPAPGLCSGRRDRPSVIFVGEGTSGGRVRLFGFFSFCFFRGGGPAFGLGV